MHQYCGFADLKTRASESAALKFRHESEISFFSFYVFKQIVFLSKEKLLFLKKNEKEKGGAEGFRSFFSPLGIFGDQRIKIETCSMNGLSQDESRIFDFHVQVNATVKAFAESL